MRVGQEALGALGGPLHRAAELARGPGDDRLLGIVEDLASRSRRRHRAPRRAACAPADASTKAPISSRMTCGFWLVVNSVYSSVVRSKSPIAARGSMAFGTSRLFTRSNSTTLVRGLAKAAAFDRRVADMPVVADIAGDLVMHGRRAGGDRRLQRRDGRQHVVVDVDRLAGVLGLGLGLGDHHGDRIADEAHLADRQHRMHRLRHRRAVLVVDLPAAGDAAEVAAYQRR